MAVYRRILPTKAWQLYLRRDVPNQVVLDVFEQRGRDHGGGLRWVFGRRCFGHRCCER